MCLIRVSAGMASPLLGVAAVNSLLFTAFSVAKKIVSPYPDLSIGQVSLAGGIAGGVNALLASPGESGSASVDLPWLGEELTVTTIASAGCSRDVQGPFPNRPPCRVTHR